MAYLLGIAVEKDYGGVIALLELSAQKDNLRALSQLAALYKEGIATTIDYGKALEYCEKALAIRERIFGP
jgi:TPR repeat protein